MKNKDLNKSKVTLDIIKRLEPLGKAYDLGFKKGKIEALQTLNIWIYHHQPTTGEIMVEIDKRIVEIKEKKKK